VVSECLLGIALDASVRERAWSCIAVTDGWSLYVCCRSFLHVVVVVETASVGSCAVHRYCGRGVLFIVYDDGFEDCRAVFIVQPTGELSAF